MRALFRQFSTPGGIPSHVSVPTPGSIHEGGELGYVLAHAFGAAFDNPDLIVAAVVGDGEAETGPLEGSWKSTSFLNPARDGAVLPILHLNGYKISGPTVLGARRATTTSRDLLEGTRLRGPRSSRATTRRACTRRSPRRSTAAIDRIRAIQAERARAARRHRERPRWPAIVLRTPKGWTGPEGRRRPAGRGHVPRAPGAAARRRGRTPAQLAMLEAWLRSYQPETLFDASGRLVAELAALAPQRRPAHGRQPARQRRQTARPTSTCPTSATTRSPSRSRRPCARESTRQLGEMLRDVFVRNAAAGELPPVLSRRDQLQPARRRLRGREPLLRRHARSTSTITSSPDGRVMEVLSEHLCEGWLEGYLLTGRHGLFATYEAFAMVSASMIVQHTKWLEEARQSAVAGAGRRRSTSCSRPPAGATTTTASATRGPASST